MSTYKAPVSDIRFVLYDVLAADKEFARLGHAEASGRRGRAPVEGRCEYLVEPLRREREVLERELPRHGIQTPAWDNAGSITVSQDSGCRACHVVDAQAADRRRPSTTRRGRVFTGGRGA